MEFGNPEPNIILIKFTLKDQTAYKFTNSCKL